MIDSIKIDCILSPKEDAYVDGTAYTKVLSEGIERTFVVLFRKSGEFQAGDLEIAKSLMLHYASKLENMEIHPVIITQLILTYMGANLVFHRDEPKEQPEAKFHSAFFRFNTLFSTFSDLLLNGVDEFKPARQFKGKTLKGLWYKHVEDASISGMATNILNENNHGDWLMSSFIEEFGPFDGIKKFDEGHAKFLASKVTEGSLKRRAERKAMSGEWLIFEKKDDKIHLLTLASHQESDERVMARIKGS